jgi:hypothetical protein
MLHRVRQFETDEVIIYIGNIYYNKEIILYFPDMLKNKLFEGYDTKQGFDKHQTLFIE